MKMPSAHNATHSLAVLHLEMLMATEYVPGVSAVKTEMQQSCEHSLMASQRTWSRS